MSCNKPQALCRVSAGGACPVNVDLTKFDRCSDERQRIQLQVIEILTHERDGSKIESSEQDKVDAILHVAPLFARAYDRGYRCPNLIASVIESGMFGNGVAKVLGTDKITSA